MEVFQSEGFKISQNVFSRGVTPRLCCIPGFEYCLRNLMTSCLPVSDFGFATGREVPAQAGQQSRWCCERLEEGHILYFNPIPFDLPEADRLFLRSCQLGDSRFHKNVSYRPSEDLVRGFTAP